MSDESTKIVTVPNLLSVSRAFLIVPIIITLHRNQLILAIALMAAGVMTDFFDGYIARKYEIISPLGKVLDPITDKLTIGMMVIYLLAFRDLPWWFLSLMVFRDVTIILSAAYLMNAHKKAFQANFSGKISINLIALTIIMYVINWAPVKVYVMYLATVTLGISWIRYMRVYFIYLKIHLRRKSGSKHYA